ncbi:1,4-dihydroxy-2-naphthoate octaprenyltransferase [Acidobacteriota bacterium]
MNQDQKPSDSSTDGAGKPGFLKTWWVAVRPFALPASTMPVIFGTILAVTVGQAQFNLLLFLAAFIGMAVLHSGANLLNDIYDYRKGIDRHVNPVSGAVVRGWVSERQGLLAAWFLLTVGSLLGLFIVVTVGRPILWIGLSGVAIGILYTWGSWELKYNALGDLAVFLNFGILGALGAWTVQSGSLSWVPVVWAIPMSLLVAAILHANNWRDIRSDKEGGIHTMAGLFGDRGSIFYYAFLLFCPFAFVIVLICLSWLVDIEPRMPLTFLITLVALPLALKLMKKGLKRHNPDQPLDFVALDGETAKLNLLFGLLCSAALGLDALIGFWIH